MKKLLILLSAFSISIISYAQPPHTIMYTKSELTGKIRASKDSDFINIDSKYTTHQYMYIRKKAYDNYKKMYYAALNEDIKLTILSAYRSFYQQKCIWEKKWNTLAHLTNKDRAKEILKYSALPGTSRHHWGTDIDIISVNMKYWNSSDGKKAYQWLKENAHKYGFYEAYTNDTTRSGYMPEPWHWSYKPLAKEMYIQYTSNLPTTEIKDYLGAESIVTDSIINVYVTNINSTLK